MSAPAPSRPLPAPSLLSAASRAPSTAPPLSHHDILALIEPFSRHGLKLDLPASDRMARRLVFRPASAEASIAVAGQASDSAAAADLRVHYVLDLAEARRPEITRHLQGPQAMSARLQARGGGLAELLACIHAVPLHRQWLRLPGSTVALSHRIELARPRVRPGAAPLSADTATAPSAGVPIPDPTQTPTPAPTQMPAQVLTEALAHVAGCRLYMRVPRVAGMPAELELLPVGAMPNAVGPVLTGQPPPQTLPEPPADLLAVLGLRWSRLSRLRGAWRSTVQLVRREPARSADAQAKLLQAVAHLAQTLAEPPARFHQRFARARWAVTLRRATPLTVALGLIAAAALVPVLDLKEGSVLRMLIFNSPPLLMVWMFALREFPRIELPPLPRRPPADAWAALVAAPPAAAAATTTTPEARP